MCFCFTFSLLLGGWGGECKGNRPACYRDSHFDTCYPDGMVVGDVNGYAITFTSSSAVANYLPDGTTSAILSRNYTDPPNDSDLGNLASQLTALNLNVEFDLCDSTFSTSVLYLKHQVYCSAGPCNGMTVSEILDLGNRILGATITAPFELGDFNKCVTNINVNYDNCDRDNQHLCSPDSNASTATSSGPTSTPSSQPSSSPSSKPSLSSSAPSSGPTTDREEETSEADALSTYYREYTCSSIGDPPRILDTNGGEQVTFPIFNDDLCTLWRIGPRMDQRVPVARSYQGHDWEVYAGEFSEKIQFDCGTACNTTTLPVLEVDQRYELVSFTHSIPDTDQIARFLEQATFGPTRRTIDAFPGYVEWIKEQIALPYTSHRRSYRSRLNHRKTTTSNQGVATHPCKKGTRYRKYAFTDKDKKTLLEIRTDPVTSRKVLLRDGQARTVLPHTELYQGRELLGDGL